MVYDRIRIQPQSEILIQQFNSLEIIKKRKNIIHY